MFAKWTERLPTKLSSSGFWYVGIAMLISAGAYQSGSNVLFLALAVLLSALLLNGLYSWWNFSKFTPHHLKTEGNRVRANEKAWIILEFSDSKTWMPSMGLTAVIKVIPPSSRPFFLQANIPIRGDSARIKTSLDWTPLQRGLHRIEWSHVESDYPFGLILKKMKWSGSLNILCWPHSNVSINPRSVLTESGVRGRRIPSRHAAEMGEGDIIGIRKATPHDNRRAIHWKKTAQIGFPVAKLRQPDEGSLEWSVRFDFHASWFDAPGAVDEYCAAIASLSETWKQQGHRVEFTLHQHPPVRVENHESWCKLMDQLALIQPEPIQLQPLSSHQNQTIVTLTPEDVEAMST